MHRRVFRNERGTATRLLSVGWDMTAEVEAADRLRQQVAHARVITERFNLATRAAGISSWEFDLHKTEYMWDDNRLTGIGVDDLPIDKLGAAMREVLDPEALENCDRLIRDVIAQGIDHTRIVYVRVPRKG